MRKGLLQFLLLCLATVAVSVGCVSFGGSPPSISLGFPIDCPLGDRCFILRVVMRFVGRKYESGTIAPGRWTGIYELRRDEEALISVNQTFDVIETEPRL